MFIDGLFFFFVLFLLSLRFTLLLLPEDLVQFRDRLSSNTCNELSDLALRYDTTDGWTGLYEYFLFMMMGGYTYDGGEGRDSCGLVYNESLELMFENP